MSTKPDRTFPIAATRLQKVAELAIHSALTELPGGGLLSDLFKTRREEMRSAVHEANEKRLAAFYDELLNAKVRMDPSMARVFLDSADFQAILRACMADIESEKVGAYATLVQSIATGTLEAQVCRHFILSLRDLSAGELDLLRRGYVAREHNLMPPQGAGRLNQLDFFTAGQPGSFQSIHLMNLVNRGFVHEKKLSELGVAFVHAIWRPEQLTPTAIEHTTWSGQAVAVVCSEAESKPVVQIVNQLASFLHSRRHQSSTNFLRGDLLERMGRLTTHSILLIGDDVRPFKEHADVLKELTIKVPTLGVLITPNTQIPLDIPLIGCVRFDSNDAKASLSDIGRRLFQ